MPLPTLKPKAKPEREAVSSSTQVAQVRPQPRPKKPAKEAAKTVRVGARTRLRETTGAVGATKFRVVLIQEGLGNLRDCCYYTKECLQSAVPLFEGLKCYADHPTMIEEQIQPERSTRDILGHYEDVAYVEDEGRGELQATFVICEGAHFDWARSLLTNAIAYATKYEDAEFVGFSINAHGEAGEAPIQDVLASAPAACREKLLQAAAEGIETVQPVSVLKDATSVDLVTEAGAGGKILTMMERAKMPKPSKSATEKSEIEKLKEQNAKLAKDLEAANKKVTEAGGMPAGADDGADGDGATTDHADAAQDAALFKKMISQYLGDDHGVDQDEAMHMAQHAYEAYQEEGMAPHEAYEAAGMHMKMAAKIGKKQAPPADGAAPAEPTEAEHEEGNSPANMNPGKKAPAQEAAHVSKDLIQSRAEIAKLRESNQALEARMYLNEKLGACDRSPEFMKQFKEALGKPKSVAQIEVVWSTFTKAFDAGRADVEAEDDTDSVLGSEKGAGLREAGSVGAKVYDFSDCAS